SWRGSAPLWLAIPLVAIWSNFHGGFFVGIVVMGVYGAATVTSDIAAGRGPRRGLGIIAITAAAAASTLCTFLIPPARDTWHTLISSILNPMTHYAILDWKPLIAALTTAPSGSIEQKYFVVVLFFFAAAALSVILTPKRADAPLVAVAGVMLAAAFMAVRNVPIAAIAIAPVIRATWACCCGRARLLPHTLRALERCRVGVDWSLKSLLPSSPSGSRGTVEFCRAASTHPTILPMPSTS